MFWLTLLAIYTLNDWTIIGVDGRPIGFERKLKNQSSSIMLIDSHVLIQCSFNRWNISKLFCLETMDPNKFNVTKYQSINNNIDTVVIDNEPVNFMFNPHPFKSSNNDIDNESKKPKCIEFNANNTRPNEMIEFRVNFIELNRQKNFIPRIILIMHNDDGVEIEEQHKQQFIDFVRWNQNEFNNNNHDSSSLNNTHYYRYNNVSKQQHQQQQQSTNHMNEKEKILVTKFARLAVSIQLIKSNIDCYFNENIIIGNHMINNMSTEFLMFDCPIDYDQLNDDNIDNDNSFRIRINIEPIHVNDNDNNQKHSIDKIEICGFQAFSIANEQCGQPSIPINGLVTQIQRSNDHLIAQYTCIQGYRIANMKNELKTGLNFDHDHQSNNNDQKFQNNKNKTDKHLSSSSIDNDIMERTCNPKIHRWTPDFNDVLCVPKYWCRNPPPMPDATKFLFEYSKLDNLNRAVADLSMATLRCLMVTHNVKPYTIYRCDRSGEWIKVGKVANYTEPEPDCIPSKYRTGVPPPSPNGRYYRGYRRYYYHYYPPQSSSNMNTVLWGHKLTDNKYLTYYGGAGIVILFLASFIILIHVRRMAKKMSTQMREQTYMSMEKSNNDAFMSMGSANQMDTNPPDYYSETNFFDANTMYSSDLPPPATPISMPVNGSSGSSGGGGVGGKSTKHDLSSNFDSIKF
ncbi:hypothetical protein DERP_014636 [Dermatophagoides pteronyssinus]|uniref:Uncharacterized protein n=2 Tax=Dermatophagoides pteronyssinus TaxID=6956 RepID=A0ABQ8IU19_DERPT|nr:hypothetical protein DERP_014636 [Dermatophagoides pteronyssinus]